MRSTWIFLSFAGLTAATNAPRAFAWGAVGHETIAQIAETILTARDEGRPAAQKTMDKIHAILGAGDCAKENLPPAPTFADVDYGGPQASEFVQSAIWLDDARASYSDAPKAGAPERSAADKVFLGSAEWHFIDIPYEADRATFDTGTVCENRACAPSKIEDMLAKLVAMRNIDTTAGLERDVVLDKCRALKTVVHLVGDLHQPMHAIDYRNDRGGNDRQVDFFAQGNVLSQGDAARAKRGNLHSLWDGGLLKDAMQREGVADVRKFAAVLVAELASGAKGPPANEKMPYTPLTPFSMLTKSVWDWAWETHQGGVDSYQDESGAQRGPTLPALPPVQPGKRQGQAPAFEVRTQYSAAADQLIREQLKKGGLRLADLLDKALNE